jgi:membrane protein required for beta-lactamase induction
MPLEVVYGLAYLGGVGLRHLSIEQGYHETSALLDHIRQNCRLGQMIWIAIQWTQVTAGMGFALLGAPERFLPHAFGKWFSSLRDFPADSEVTLDIVNIYKVCTRRVHNRILMDDAP